MRTSASEQGSQDSGLKMHDASEARTFSLKTFEEVNLASTIPRGFRSYCLASTVHAKRHTTEVGKHVTSTSQGDNNSGYGDRCWF